ncbi:DNA modification methylase [Halogeometricum borinquense DSM 11551]|uniref:site-specific DNA-methyltransferase (cytosine-N(4)-specific) n=2 Tax=Halogeometricum borinquense (strain ATCC 700274 / DSM 11551 / JCM 10706 / KCTC 4070 / PR3) TaxID=469382 RepID=L9UXB2_HALBP|nr:DNA modification methylase [Halogeometricum borinquense DSM 11551]
MRTGKYPMSNQDLSHPTEVKDFYLFDENVRRFANIFSNNLDKILIPTNFRDPEKDDLSRFSAQVKNDGGVDTATLDSHSLKDYFEKNVAFSHYFYDEIKDHYKLREDGLWSKDGLIEIIETHINTDSVSFPHEVSFREFYTNLVRLGDESATNTPEETIDLRVRERLESHPDVVADLDKELKTFFRLREFGLPPTEEIRRIHGFKHEKNETELELHEADARYITPFNTAEERSRSEIPVKEESVDLIITSPPYWRKREYLDEDDEEFGQESDPEEYVENLVTILDQWKKFLKPTGSVFLNIGDTYRYKSLQGIPGLFAEKARKGDWTVRNDIIWTKENGVPSPVDDRLAPRHEHIFHLVLDRDDYYYDREAYIDLYQTGANPIDVWSMSHDRNTRNHLAPFPEDLARRALTLACPSQVCEDCGAPRRRVTNKNKDELISDLDDPEELVNHLIKYEYYKLNPRRGQAQRAIKRFVESELGFEHLRAVQAVGISDAGKAKEYQTGAGRNKKSTQELADDAKEVLKGYFREFTFPQRQTVRWTECECDADYSPGRVLDPFAGSGTTLKVASKLGYHAHGVDLDTSHASHLFEDM